MRKMNKQLAALAMAAGSVVAGWSTSACFAARAAKPAAPAAPAAQVAAPAMTLDAAIVALRKHEFGQSRLALVAVSDAVVQASTDPAKRAEMAKKLVEVLTSDSTKDARQFVCRELAIIGGDESVPALAKLLGDEGMSDYARYALERMENASAGAALRDAMPSLKGRQLIGTINSIGERRDTQALDALTAMLGNSEPTVANAAASALAKIGGPKAVAALAAARQKAPAGSKLAITDAYLLSLEGLAASGQKEQAAQAYEQLNATGEPATTRIAALRGLLAMRGEKAVPALVEALKSNDAQVQLAAAGFVAVVPGDAAVNAVAATFGQLPAGAQAVALEAVAGKPSQVSRGLAAQAIKSNEASVRLAAIRAMGRLGDAGSVAVLAQLAASATGAEQQTARASLEQINGAGVDEAIVQGIAKGDAKVRVELIRALGTRGTASAMPAVLAAAKDADGSIRIEAIKTIEAIGTEKEIPALLDLLSSAKDAGEGKAIESALVATCRKIGDGSDNDKSAAPVLAAMGKADVPSKCAMLRVLSRIQGKQAMEAIRAAMKDANGEISDAAIRAITDLSDPAVAADQLELAKNAPKENYKVLALRGYIRVAGLREVKPADRLKMYKEAMGLATRAEEKRMVLSGVSNITNAAALNFVKPYLDDKTIAEEAASSAVAIAAKVTGSDDLVKTTMAKVVEVAKNAKVKQSAQQIMGAKK